MFLSFKRILKSGWEKFVRDRSSTAAALVVMIITLFVMSLLFLLEGMSTFVIARLHDGIDMSAYFKDTATEEEILKIRQELLAIPEVKEAEYVSKEEALKRFTEAHKENRAVLDSLDAIGSNPLLPALSIKAQDPSQYARISEFLTSNSFQSLIEKIDYHDRAPVIEQILKITSGIQVSSFAVIILLAAVAVLVAFNTIRLTIYASRQEIEIMRLVGASNWFIRAPFLIQGILVGILATVLALLLLSFASFFAAWKVHLFTGFPLKEYLRDHFFELLGLELLVGICLGVISSTIAIRRYLKV
ncbi:MAG: permease-like cell division protein FtsX [Patescibacteria group bacterium]